MRNKFKRKKDISEPQLLKRLQLYEPSMQHNSEIIKIKALNVPSCLNFVSKEKNMRQQDCIYKCF